MEPIADLTRRAAELVVEGRRAVLGVTGPPGAGKTTLCERLVRELGRYAPVDRNADWSASLPMDGFHLADAQLERIGLLDRKGAPETFDAVGYVAMIERILADTGETVYAPGFERDLEQPIAAAIAIPASARLIITEGNYLLLPGPHWNRLPELLAETWYLDTADAPRRERLLRRHIEFGKPPDAAEAWVARLDDANARLVAETRHRANLVIDV